MNRLEQIYVSAIEVLDEYFMDEMESVLESKSNKEYNKLVNKIQRHMIRNGQILDVDVNTYFYDVSLVVARALNNVLYMLQRCNRK